MMKNVYSVGQVNTYIKNMFAQDFMMQRISVKGEVSNCKYHSSGHIYFTLKDPAGTINAIMFAGNRRGLSFQMKEGDKVIVTGSVEVYERDGKYQLYAREIELDGAGNLYLKFEALKKELEEMGMFAPEYKKRIPTYIRRLGIVTAPTGAAVQDIRNISARRNPYVQLILYPALVQGEGAVSSIVNGIRALDALGVDVIIVGRGGGSIEDLWAFNEEIVARAIFECSVPVISAVGHQTDWTIADYVADLRAPTPSAAAELAVYSYRETVIALREAEYSLNWQMTNLLKIKKLKLARYMTMLSHESPQNLINERRMYLTDMQEKIEGLMKQKLISSRHQLELYVQEMKGLSPLYKLQGGYAYVSDENGKNINSVDDIDKGEQINLAFKDGYAKAVISSKEKA